MPAALAERSLLATATATANAVANANSNGGQAVAQADARAQSTGSGNANANAVANAISSGSGTAYAQAVADAQAQASDCKAPQLIRELFWRLRQTADPRSSLKPLLPSARRATARPPRRRLLRQVDVTQLAHRPGGRPRRMCSVPVLPQHARRN